LEIKEILRRSIRILYISKKPSKVEFTKVAKITGIGMILCGIVGFIMAFLLSLI